MKTTMSTMRKTSKKISKNVQPEFQRRRPFHKRRSLGFNNTLPSIDEGLFLMWLILKLGMRGCLCGSGEVSAVDGGSWVLGIAFVLFCVFYGLGFDFFG